MTRKRPLPKPLSVGEEALAQHLQAYGIEFEREHRFHPPRLWRFDFCLRRPIPRRAGLAVEVEGGVFTNGRHTRGKSFEDDLRKYNQAALDGWCVLRFSTGMVLSGEAIDQIVSAVR